MNMKGSKLNQNKIRERLIDQEIEMVMRYVRERERDRLV